MIHRRCARSLLVLAALALPLRALAGDVTSIPVGPNSLGACPGAAITPSQVVSGQFPAALMGAYVMLPIEVPEGTTQVRVKYCYEGGGNTVDLGIWQARDGETPWGEAQFRGWGGSSHPDVAISPQGFSTEAEYLAEPAGYVPGRTTRGFLPGPIPAGTWAAELGVGAVSGSRRRTSSRIGASRSSCRAIRPSRPSRTCRRAYDATPADAKRGLVRGRPARPRRAFRARRRDDERGLRLRVPRVDDGGAGLDFITLSDYVTSSGVGRDRPLPGAAPGQAGDPQRRDHHLPRPRDEPRQRSATSTTAPAPSHELRADGALTLLRAAQPPAEIFAAIRDAGGIAQINHVTTARRHHGLLPPHCRGCPWDYSAEETEYGDVAAIEVQSGSPFKYGTSPPRRSRSGTRRSRRHEIAAVGSSDSHTACIPPCDATESPIGDATTVVYAARSRSRASSTASAPGTPT